MLGEPFSGKTTIFNHLRILYGNGITKFERGTASGSIIGGLADRLVVAWKVWSDTYDQERQKAEICAKRHDQFLHEFYHTCQQVLRHLWNDEGVRNTILTRIGPLLDDNTR